MNVGNGEQDIALRKEPHAGDDIALPEDDKRLQRVLQVQQPAVTNPAVSSATDAGICNCSA
jgi:hypothetical protein